MPAAYQAVLTTLGRSGDFKDGVLKVNLGHSDLKVNIHGRAVPTGLGFGGWIAMTNGDQDTTLTVPVPDHKELKTGTLSSIIRQ